MNHAPKSIEELRDQLATANARSEKLPPVDLSALNRLVAHTPSDMTCTVEAGITLAALQTALGQHRQWLPVDPSRPEQLTIGQLLAFNESGPHRCGFGTIREHLLGITVALADGRLIKSGGQVVKNVAGFDLCKLFVGAHNSLGIIVSATFKVQPLSELEMFAAITCDSLRHANQVIERVLDSDLSPVVFDLHNLDGLQLVVGIAGGRANVEWQMARAAELQLRPLPALSYPAKFWRSDAATPLRRWSVLPSRLTESLGTLGQSEFIAGAADGLIWYRGGPTPPPVAQPVKLLQRIKDAYDPRHILPDIPT